MGFSRTSLEAPSGVDFFFSKIPRQVPSRTQPGVFSRCCRISPAVHSGIPPEIPSPRILLEIHPGVLSKIPPEIPSEIILAVLLIYLRRFHLEFLQEFLPGLIFINFPVD